MSKYAHHVYFKMYHDSSPDRNAEQKTIVHTSTGKKEDAMKKVRELLGNDANLNIIDHEVHKIEESQKAWMTAYTKGSKELQKRLEKVHKNNPEFQHFVKKFGFGGTLSVKQSGMQKTSSVATPAPVDKPNPEMKKGPTSREAIIKAAAEKIRDRRLAAANRAAFGGELGGGTTLYNAGFRRYSEEVHFKDASYMMRRGGWVVKRNGKVTSAVLPTEKHAQDFINSTRMTLGRKLAKVVRKKAKDIARGMGRMSLATEGFDDYHELAKELVKRHGKDIKPEHIKDIEDERDTHNPLDREELMKHVKKITESAANRRRVRSYDSAVMPELKPLRVKPKEKPPFTPDKPSKNLGVVVGKNPAGYSKARHLARLGLKKAIESDRVNRAIDYISNPRYSVLNKNTIKDILKGK